MHAFGSYCNFAIKYSHTHKRRWTKETCDMDPKGSAVTAMELTQELAFTKDRTMNSKRRRKTMETTTKVGGEVRRLHIIYFLSRMGRIEQPHLIRVHHLHRNGVYLRDVKRWLTDLRGKDMPDAFAWSYKRRYKSGFVWQDLLDDDLITPISDNEYVLKGSQIMPTTAFGPCIYDEKETSTLKDDQPVEVEDQQHHQQQPSPKQPCQRDPDPKIDTPTKLSSEIFKESPMFGSESSTLTDDSMKHEEEANKQHSPREVTEKFDNYYSPSSLYCTLLNKKKTNENKMEKNGTPSSSYSWSSSSKSTYTKSKSYSSGASHMFRNLISCGTADTNDNVLVTLNRGKNASNKTTNKSDIKSEICKPEKIGGSARVFGTCWNQQQQQHSDRKSFDGMKGSKKQSEFANPRPISAAYKPVGVPTCSQCGESFKPEKLHTHMKSCKGMKALAKTAAASVEKSPSQRSVNSSHKESTSGYFLTN